MTRRPLIIDNICACISAVAEFPPPTEVWANIPRRLPRRRGHAGVFPAEEVAGSRLSVDVAVKPQLGLAWRRTRGGLNDIDRGVPQVSGAASHRLNLSAPTDERGGEARQLFTVTSAGGGK